MKYNFLTVDRSITVGHVDGGYLCVMPDFIPFTFYKEELEHNKLYYLLGNRLHHQNVEINFTGIISCSFKNNDFRLEMDFKFESGLLRDRFLRNWTLINYPPQNRDEDKGSIPFK